MIWHLWDVRLILVATDHYADNGNIRDRSHRMFHFLRAGRLVILGRLKAERRRVLAPKPRRDESLSCVTPARLRLDSRQTAGFAPKCMFRLTHAVPQDVKVTDG